jgi:hypothetical protein
MAKTVSGKSHLNYSKSRQGPLESRPRNCCLHLTPDSSGDRGVAPAKCSEDGAKDWAESKSKAPNSQYSSAAEDGGKEDPM